MLYQGYNKRVRRSTCSLSCMQCPVDHLRRPYDHARHLYDVHGLDKNTTCPWCRLDFSSPGLMKNIDHLTECLRRLEAQTKEYLELLRSEKTMLGCCGDDFTTPCDLERHVRERHGLCCPWCREEGRHSLEHLTTCLKGRVVPVLKPANTNRKPCEPCLSFDSREERGKFLGRKRIENVSPFFYESFGESLKADEEGEFRFDEASGLGSDAAWYVRRFVEDKDWKWFHYSVKGFAFESFHRAFEGNESVSLLPFWCLCDGAVDEKKPPAYSHHRHGMAVCRDGGKSFLAAWSKVDGDRKFPHQNAKSYKIVSTAHHLCNAIAYLGGTKSRCGGRKKNHLRKTPTECHYRINRPICPHGNFYLHMCYENGLEDRLNTLHANRDVHDLPSLRSEGRILRVRLGDFPKGSMTGCSPPWAGMDKRAYFEERAAKGEGYVECMDDREYVLKSKVQKRMAKSVLEVRKQACVEKKAILEKMGEMVRSRDARIRELESKLNS